jgi:outer membrane protein
MRDILGNVVFAILGVLVAAPAAADTFKLSDALAVAYATNPELEAARAKVRAADEGVAEARGGWRPSANVSGSYGYQDQRTQISSFIQDLRFPPLNAQATVSQPVVTGGQVYAEVQRAVALVRAARADLLSAEQQILLAAATSYMDVVRDSANLDLHRDDVDVLARQRDSTTIQLKAGDATRTDLDEVDGRLAGAQADLATAQQQLTQSRNAFERIIGRPAETLEEAPALPPLPGSQDQALASAARLSPQIQSAQASDRAAQYAIDDAVGALLPHASIVAQYDYSPDSLSSGYGVLAKVSTLNVVGQLSIPLYQGGAEDAKIREAKQDRVQTRLGITDADQAARQSVNDAWAFLSASQTALAFNTRRVAAGKRALDGVIEQQHQGERSTLDILIAEQDRLAAEVALAGSRHDTFVASYQLLAAMGRLTAPVLRLNVKLYDPNDHYDEDAGSWFGFGE